MSYVMLIGSLSKESRVKKGDVEKNLLRLESVVFNSSVR